MKDERPQLQARLNTLNGTDYMRRLASYMLAQVRHRRYYMEPYPLLRVMEN